MRSKSYQILAVVSSIAFLGPNCYGATISGTVKGPDGAPFVGAFVEARDMKTKITSMRLSDSQGHYQVEDLPVGEYQVLIRAVGFQAAPHTGVNLTATQNTSVDIALQKGTVRWKDANLYQAEKLWPESKGKDALFGTCFVCHGFQVSMASVSRDLEGWSSRVQYMRDSEHPRLGFRGLNDEKAALIAAYLTTLYSPDSVLPKSPADMPGYKETVRKFSSEALKIAFVEYDMPASSISRMPFSAFPDKKGIVWIPNFGTANKLTRLDPQTGQMTDFPLPNEGTAGNHSAYPAPDGAVWVAEQASNKLGRWDPVTQKITEYQAAYALGHEGDESNGAKHTVRVDPAGNAWASGYPLTRFDIETKKFTEFREAPHVYGIEIDRTTGNMWFTNSDSNEIGRADWKTQKIMQWPIPTKGSATRRIEVDPNGVVWFGQYNSGKLGRFDPKTETFKEYMPPTGPETHPYGLELDGDGNVWISSYYFDELLCFNPKTETFTEYPFPHSENTIRELYYEASTGRMWYGSPSNDKVGYFYLTSKTKGGKAANQ